MPEAGGALEAQVLREAVVERWSGQWLRFRAEPNEWVPAVLVKPAGVKRPPVVIAHHGHSSNKEISLFGQWGGDPRLRQAPEAALCDHGLAVLAIDARCHGERLGGEPPSVAEQPRAWTDHFEREWQWLARRCLVTGTALQALLIHDVTRAIDYLQTRADLDASRLGMYGYSMGGTTCWATTLLEPRIRAAVAGGCMLTYDAALRFRRDASWHAWVPGLCRHATRAQLVAAIAPRPLLTIHGSDDYPRDGVPPIFNDAAEAYARHGCPDRFHARFIPGNHTAAMQNPAMIEEAGRWFARWL